MNIKEETQRIRDMGAIVVELNDCGFDDAIELIDRLTKERDAAEHKLSVAEPVVAAACRVVAADTYKHPILSREDAVKAGAAQLHDAVGKWHGAQPAARYSPQDTVERSDG